MINKNCWINLVIGEIFFAIGIIFFNCFCILLGLISFICFFIGNILVQRNKREGMNNEN